MGDEDRKRKYGEWSYEFGAFEARWLVVGEWEFAKWGEGGNVDIYVDV
jgi:hypothetical protein